MRNDQNNNISPANDRNAKESVKESLKKNAVSEIIAAIADIIVSVFDFLN